MAIANITNNILTDSGVSTSSLLPLTGGTLTGALSGTTADFSGLGTFYQLTMTGATAGRIFYAQTGGVISQSGNLNWNETNGMLGVGTPNPSAVITAFSTNAATQFKAAGTAPAFTFSQSLTTSTYACVFGLATSANHFITGTAAGDMAIANQSTTAGAIVFGTGTAEKMRMSSSGNFGIGTSSPSSLNAGANQLVVGNGSSTQGLTIYTGSASDGNIYFANGTTGSQAYNGAIVYNHSSNYMIFATNGGSERMRITSGGTLLVNQTSISAAAAGGKMQVAADILSTGSLAGYFWENRSGGVTSNTNWYGWYTTSGTIYLYNGSANIASINTSSGAYTALSDINKKKDFEASTIGLDAILGLKPTLYRMKTDDENAQKQLGFIAQEVKEFIPQAYIQTKGEKEDFIGLDDRPIIAALVKAVQELEARIKQLENK